MYNFIALALLVAFIVWLVPLIAIWAVNTLFGLAIPFTLINWFAALLLICILGR